MIVVQAWKAFKGEIKAWFNDNEVENIFGIFFEADDTRQALLASSTKRR